MSVFQELYGVDSKRTFTFFASALREVAEKGLAEAEMLYVASVLAHYAHTSCYDTSCSLPVPVTLSDVFDQFVRTEYSLDDPELLEIAGSQSLLMAGFFREQMKVRHNVKWYDELGQSFYRRAGQNSKKADRQKFFDGLSKSFPHWTVTCAKMNRALRENRFLLKPQD